MWARRIEILGVKSKKLLYDFSWNFDTVQRKLTGNLKVEIASISKLLNIGNNWLINRKLTYGWGSNESNKEMLIRDFRVQFKLVKSWLGNFSKIKLANQHKGPGCTPTCWAYMLSELKWFQKPLKVSTAVIGFLLRDRSKRQR